MTHTIKCSFCGYEFYPTEADDKSACAGCPLGRGCQLTCCPRCGYRTPPEAKLVGWVRKLRQRWGSSTHRSNAETLR